MARESTLKAGNIAAVRSGSGAIAADNATLNDTNIPPAQAIDCSGYDSIYVGVEITAGSSPTMTVEPLFYDPDAADGSRWKRLQQGARDGVTAAALGNEVTPALDGTALVELRVHGHSKVFLRVTAVANPGSTTAWKILAMPGKVRRNPPFRA